MDRSRSFSPVEESLLTPEEAEYYFWLRHARRSQEPIVALDGGSGRVAIPLAEQALRVVAFEPSQEQQKRGAERAREIGVELLWRSGTPETFSLDRKSGMVALTASAFQSLLTLESQKQALCNIHNHLQVGGKLALHLTVPDVAALAAQEATWKRLDPVIDPATQRTIFRWESNRYDVVEQRCSSHLVYEMVDEEGETVSRWHRHLELAYHWPREMQLLLAIAGFEIEALYGGWNDEPFSAEATQQVWVARKAI